MRFSTITAAVAGMALTILTSAAPLEQSDPPCRVVGAMRCGAGGTIDVCTAVNRGLYWRWAADCEVGTTCIQPLGQEATCVDIPLVPLPCIMGSHICKISTGGGYEVVEGEEAVSTETFGTETVSTEAVDDNVVAAGDVGTAGDVVTTDNVAIADDLATEGDDSAVKRGVAKEQWIDDTCRWENEERCGTLGTIEICTRVHNRLVWRWAADCEVGFMCVQPFGEAPSCQSLAFTPNLCISGLCPNKAAEGEDAAGDA